MFKTVIATAAAALIVSTVATPAQAAGPWAPYNGISLNGLSDNGTNRNATIRNGTASDHQTFAIDGIELPTKR